MQISLFARHWLTIEVTSLTSFLVHWLPDESTTRRALEPRALTAGIVVAVCEAYQVWAWLTPRATNGVPLRSTTLPFWMCRPTGVAACAPPAVTLTSVAASAAARV